VVVFVATLSGGTARAAPPGRPVEWIRWFARTGFWGLVG
jgi:hypothetical protein